MTRLEEIKQRAEQATPGPWYPGYMDRVVTNRRGDGSDSICHIYEEGQPANQAFIAASREDIPYLLKLVERMRECLNKNLHDLHLSNHALNRNGYHPMFKAVEETEDLLAELAQPVQEKKH